MVWLMVVIPLLTWRQSTTEVGNGSEVFSNLDMLTAHSFKDQKLSTLAEDLKSEFFQQRKKTFNNVF